MSSNERPRKINPKFLLGESVPVSGGAERPKLRVPERLPKLPAMKNPPEVKPKTPAVDQTGLVTPNDVPEDSEAHTGAPVTPQRGLRDPGESPAPTSGGEQVTVEVAPMKNPFLPGSESEDELESKLYDRELGKAEDILRERVEEPDLNEVGSPPTEEADSQPVQFGVLPVPSKRTVNPMFQPQGAKRRKDRSDKKKVGLVLSEADWDESPDEVAAGSGDLEEAAAKAKPGTGFHLTARDVLIMRFLARYRYAYHRQLASLVDTTPDKIANRLRVLVKRGFIRKEAVSPRQFLFTNRKAGNQIVDIPFTEIRKGQISYATIPHTIGLANLGIEFERESGGLDLLGEGKGIIDWVQPMNRWKNGLWYHGEQMFGEMTVTEREIRQGQVRWRGGRSAEEMRDLIQQSILSGDPIELEEGQEGMFVVYGLQNEGGEHVPDLVIARERDSLGRPQHIAVELELTPKPMPEWKKILRNYRDNGAMYSKVYYFTHKSSIANSIKRADLDVGLGDRLVVRKYEPSDRTMPFWG